MRAPKRRKDDGISFWQSYTDLFTGIIFILILIIALLLLYLLYTPPTREGDVIEGYLNAKEYDEYPEEEQHRVEDDNDDRNHSSSSSSSHSSSSSSDDDDEETEDDDEEKNGIKAAVFVKIIDDETGEELKEEGVQFELLSADKNLQVLHTYYPELVSYQDYETREDGTFFLPEKIMQDTYYMRGLTAPEGYIPAGDVSFTIDTDRIYDWENPYVLTIPLAQAENKNSFIIHLTDSVTKEPLSGVTFDVLSKDTNASSTGVIRYEKDDVVDTLTTDEDGNAQSTDLYFGEFYMVQKTIPDGYVKVEAENLNVTVSSPLNETETQTINLKEKATAISFTLTDKLTKKPIEGAEFTLSDGENPYIFTTDDKGTFRAAGLSKDTTYTVKETKPAGSYRGGQDSFEVTVDSEGYIDGKATAKLADTNYQIQVSLNIYDRILHRHAVGEAITVKDASGEIVETYVTTTDAHLITSLEPGSYSVIRGEDDNILTIDVADTEKVQNFDAEVTNMRIVALLGGGALAGVLAIVNIIVWTIKRRKKK